MSILSPSLLFLLALASAGAEDRHAHEHPAPAAAPAQIATDSARWPTDAPLRSGMQRIESAISALAAAGEGEPMRVAEAAASIESAVQQIIRDCRLPPQADADLHTVIVPLLGEAQKLRADPASRSQRLPALQSALRDYQRLFDSGPAPDPH